MSALTIFADFDQDGRISRKAPEQDLKDAFPGLIVLPNIDADGRRLPRKVAISSAVPLDHTRTRSGVDDEGATLFVRIDDPAARELTFEAVGEPAAHLTFADARYRRLRNKGRAFVYDLHGVGEHRFFVETTSLRGTPLASSEARAAEPGQFNVTATLTAADGGQLAQETFTGTVAPLILLDSLRTPGRLYMCELGEQDIIDRGNHPSVAEVEAVIGRIGGVDFLRIPEDVNNGDAWIQDQFELGVCTAPFADLRVIVHLPRLRSNVVASELGSNLATFAPGHFPSADLGLFDDFYDREIGSASVAGGTRRTFLFRDSFELAMRMDRLWELWHFIRQLYFVADVTKTLRDRTLETELAVVQQKSFVEARFTVGAAVGRLRRLLDRRMAVPNLKDGQREVMQQQKKLLSARFSLVQRTLIIGGGAALGTVRVPTDAFGDLVFDQRQINDMDQNLAGKHGSPNFGGNIEVSPALPGAPFGKIAFGANRKDFTRAADPDLIAFLERQGVQPVVDVDTAWLDVAHVDEVMAFVPAPASRAQSGVAVASPRMGMKIIDTAFAVYMEGGGTKAVAAGNDENLPHPALRDHTDEGDAPVTRMLRGRYWLHHVPKDAFARIEPPLIYRDMVRHYPVDFHLLQDGHEVIAYNSEPGRDRYYNAALSIRELRYFGRYTNDWLAENTMAPLYKMLKGKFRGLYLVELPVLYDEVNWVVTDAKTGDIAPDFDNEKTSAFLPNAVNLQVLGDHVLVPRPYGPRAAPEIAARILSRVAPDMQSVFTASVLSSTVFTQTVHWVRRPISPGASGSDLSRIAEEFKDGFIGLEDEEIRELILKANRRQFGNRPNPDDGFADLNEGWRRLLIPEGTVDLFEAFVRLRLEALGVRVHFVDTWYYHIRLGEIHCGTNVLRYAPRKVPKWWEVSEPSMD